MEYKVTKDFSPSYSDYVKKELENAPAQYKNFKEKYPDAVFLFRIGDFYETYCDDAAVCADVLGVTLTSRSGDKKYRMAGFPNHALDTYLPKLIRAGKRVCLCEPIR